MFSMFSLILVFNKKRKISKKMFVDKKGPHF